jgi:hypothetical protein
MVELKRIIKIFVFPGLPGIPGVHVIFEIQNYKSCIDSESLHYKLQEFIQYFGYF